MLEENNTEVYRDAKGYIHITKFIAQFRLKMYYLVLDFSAKVNIMYESHASLIAAKSCVCETLHHYIRDKINQLAELVFITDMISSGAPHLTQCCGIAEHSAG